jgi:hypothetical protein
MANKSPPSIGQTISTFSFILFGLLLALAALSEETALKSAVIGVCAAYSIAGAERFLIQSAVNRYRNRHQE